MRVGIACPYTWENPGGVQEHIRDLAEALIDLGHQFPVISPADDDNPVVPDYVVPACRAVPVPYNGSVGRLAFGFLSASRVRRWVQGRPSSTCCTCTSPSCRAWACWPAGSPPARRGDRAHRGIPRSRWMLRRAARTCSSALEKISARIAVSEAARTTQVEHLGGDAWADPERGLGAAGTRRRTRFPAGPGAGGALGFLGRMDESRKGLAVLLAAFEISVLSGPGLRLLVAGRGTPKR